MKNLLVFDCEATSLHGSTFAIGCIVATRDEKIAKKMIWQSFGNAMISENQAKNCVKAELSEMEENGYYIIDSFELLSLEGKEKAGEWVKGNVIPNLSDMPTCKTDLELRNRFFDFYMKYKENCNVYSDVNYPVETNFLAAVVADDIETREWSMPYPLFDISMTVDVSINRCEKYKKETGLKLRKHNPTDDSIASLHCFLND